MIIFPLLVIMLRKCRNWNLNCFSFVYLFTGFTTSLQSRAIHLTVHDGLQLARHEFAESQIRQIQEKANGCERGGGEIWGFVVFRRFSPENKQTRTNFFRFQSSVVSPHARDRFSRDVMWIGNWRRCCGHLEHEQFTPLHVHSTSWWISCKVLICYWTCWNSRSQF